MVFYAVIAIASGIVWVLTLPKHPDLRCQEAWRGADDECLSKGLEGKTCEEIADVAKSCCLRAK